MKPKSNLRFFLLAAGSSLLAISSASAQTNLVANRTTPALSVSASNSTNYNITGITEQNSYNGVIRNTSGNNTLSGNMVLNSPSGGIRFDTSGGNLTGITLGGSGSVDPGNSPGILTAADTDPMGGLDYNFEFTAAGLPTWSNAAASVNDVLRLTDAATPFNSALGASNTISIYLNAGALTLGQIFTGGFFTDRNVSFLSSIDTATFRYLVATGGVGMETYNGQNYDLYTGPLTFDRDTGRPL